MLIFRVVAILVASYLTGVGVPLTLPINTVLLAATVAIILAIINHTIRPILAIITLPLNVITLGLFSLVLNGLMVMLASKLVPGFIIPSLLVAIVFSIIVSVINWFVSKMEDR